MNTRASASVGLLLIVALGGCGVDSPCETADLGPPVAPPAFAVVTSDRFSTAIALLDADGALVEEAWIDSGTVRPGIAAALSGDVVLPSAPFDGELVLLDRFGVDLVTRIELARGEVIAQLPTQLGREESAGGYRANPQDVLALDDGRLLVSRHEPNLDPAAPPLDRGNDLVLVDPSASVVVERIDLSPLDASVRGVRAFARPGRMARLPGGLVAIGLARLDASFRVAGPGAIAVVELATATVHEVTLGGLENCGELRPVRGDPSRVVVTCAGATFTDGTGRRAAAGVAMVHAPSVDGIFVEHVFFARDHAALSPPSGPPLSLGGARVAVVAMGDAGRSPDALVAIDLAANEATSVLETEDAFVLGAGALSSDGALLLVPDARRGVHRVRVSADGALSALDVVDVSPCRRLPAREIGALR